jgi:hypothetical protein
VQHGSDAETTVDISEKETCIRSFYHRRGSITRRELSGGRAGAVFLANALDPDPADQRKASALKKIGGRVYHGHSLPWFFFGIGGRRKRPIGTPGKGMVVTVKERNIIKIINYKVLQEQGGRGDKIQNATICLIG